MLETNPNSPVFQHGVNISLGERTGCLSSTTSGASTASSKISTVVIHTEGKPLIQVTVRIGISSLRKQGFCFQRCHRRFLPPACTSHLHTHCFHDPHVPFCTILPMCNTLPSACVRPLCFPSVISKRGCARVEMELSSVSRVPRRSAMPCNLQIFLG